MSRTSGFTRFGFKTGHAIAWLVMACIVGLGLGQLNWISYLEIARRGACVQGTVIEVLPEMHRTVRYSYEVQGQKYEGQTQSGPPNLPIEKLTAGASLSVYYDPENPKRSIIGDPMAALKNETAFIGLAMLFFPTFIIAYWMKWGSDLVREFRMRQP